MEKGKGIVLPRRAMFSWSDWDDNMVNTLYDSVFDDDELLEEVSQEKPQELRKVQSFKTGARWNVVHAVFLFNQAGNQIPSEASGHVAGHADNFIIEDGHVFKALCRPEADILSQLQSETSLKSFAPQYFGSVDRDGRAFIKMQNVFLSMKEPVFMDIKMGVRTFEVSEVLNSKRRMDLLQKALVIEQHNPNATITEEERLEGLTKYRFMALRDQASSSASLGFRFQGLRIGKRVSKSKDFANIKADDECKSVLEAFLEGGSKEQRTGLLTKLQSLNDAALASEWFSHHEFIGSSLLLVYDAVCPEKYGLWMIDFARSYPVDNALSHTVPWVEGTHEDGYLLGVQSLIRLWPQG